jgi:hypothetical protein
MCMRYFGDSYDIVKQLLLRWLQSFGPWSVLPMFTEPVSDEDASAFEGLIGAQVISKAVLTIRSNRQAYFSCAPSCGNLFLDPNTGIRLMVTHGVRAPEYLFASELIQLTKQRPNALTVVFDQSVGRGSEHVHLGNKLQHLHNHGVVALAYQSHACFVITGCDHSLVNRARNKIISESRLPARRFLSVGLASFADRGFGSEFGSN